MSRMRMTPLPFLLLALSPFVIFESDYALISCPLCKLNTLLDIFMIFGRNVEQHKMTSHTRMTTLSFLLLVLSPFVISDSDYALISCIFFFLTDLF